ncbi:hypothetical protein PAXINDRAFT_168701, partial [Paxillus involutus ATCC 200175]
FRFCQVAMLTLSSCIQAAFLIWAYDGQDKLRNHFSCQPTLAWTLYTCIQIKGPSLSKSYNFWLPIIIHEGILCLLAFWVDIGQNLKGIDKQDIASARRSSTGMLA